MRVVVGLGSQPDLAVLVELVAWKAARPRLTSCQLGRTRGASGVASNGAGATARATSVTAVHRGAPGRAPQDRRERRDGQIRTRPSPYHMYE